MKAIDLKEYQKQKKADEKSRNFRKNYYSELDDWEKEFFDLYLKATTAMDNLFKCVRRDYISAYDHLPMIVHLAWKDIRNKLNAKEVIKDGTQS